jgi:hypothetical protein
MTGFIISTLYEILNGWSHQIGLDGRDMQHAWKLKKKRISRKPSKEGIIGSSGLGWEKNTCTNGRQKGVGWIHLALDRV